MSGENYPVTAGVLAKAAWEIPRYLGLGDDFVFEVQVGFLPSEHGYIIRNGMESVTFSIHTHLFYRDPDTSEIDAIEVTPGALWRSCLRHFGVGLSRHWLVAFHPDVLHLLSKSLVINDRNLDAHSELRDLIVGTLVVF